MNVAEELQQMIDESPHSISSISHLAGVSRETVHKTVSRLEPPSLLTLARLCVVLDIGPRVRAKMAAALLEGELESLEEA